MPGGLPLDALIFDAAMIRPCGLSVALQVLVLQIRPAPASSGVTFYFDVEIIRVSALHFETGAAAFRQVGFASHSLPTSAATTPIGGNQ